MSVYDLIGKLSADDAVIFNRDIAYKLGLRAAIILQTLIEHEFDCESDDLGWFCPLISFISNFSTLSESEIEDAYEILIKAKFIEKSSNKIRINKEHLVNFLGENHETI